MREKKTMKKKRRIKKRRRNEQDVLKRWQWSIGKK
jgi:hypothetical protein